MKAFRDGQRRDPVPSPDSHQGQRARPVCGSGRPARALASAPRARSVANDASSVPLAGPVRRVQSCLVVGCALTDLDRTPRLGLFYRLLSAAAPTVTLSAWYE